MVVHTYTDVNGFLHDARAELESREAINNLILGVCGQLARHPERFQQPVCFKTVEENNTLHLAGIMTPPQNLLLAGLPNAKMEECATLMTDSLAGEGWKIPGVFGPKGMARMAAARLAALLKKRFRLNQNLRMYDLKKVELPAPEGGRLRMASGADLERITRWWYEARLEMMGQADPEVSNETARNRLADGDVYVWETNEPVSMASQTRPTRRGISIGMVFTPPAFRRRGYATACVGELSRKLLQEGRDFCTLYADLSNPISNSIYQKIGYRPIGDFEEYGFIESTKGTKKT
jgi:predicted GNAT family acetyltransferase